jgi:hypothetical protein
MKAGIMLAAFAGIPLKSLIAPGQQSTTQQAGELFQLPVEIQNDLLNYYTSSTFKPYVNSLFQIRLSSTDVKYVTLIEVKDIPPTTTPGGVTTLGDCYSLQFLSMRNQSSKQNTYKVKHPALGEFSLFLVPVGKRIARTNQQQYEAIINRRTS